jgi:hypothetical protein
MTIIKKKLPCGCELEVSASNNKIIPNNMTFIHKNHEEDHNDEFIEEEVNIFAFEIELKSHNVVDLVRYLMTTNQLAVNNK